MAIEKGVKPDRVEESLEVMQKDHQEWEDAVVGMYRAIPMKPSETSDKITKIYGTDLMEKITDGAVELPASFFKENFDPTYLLGQVERFVEQRVVLEEDVVLLRQAMQGLVDVGAVSLAQLDSALDTPRLEAGVTVAVETTTPVDAMSEEPVVVAETPTPSRYEIQPGDGLWKIVAEQFPDIETKDIPQKMASIAELNGLNSIEDIKAGAYLDLEEASPDFAVASEVVERSAESVAEGKTLTGVFTSEVYDPSDKVKEPVVKSDPVAASGVQDIPLYEIQPGDTLWKIVAEQFPDIETKDIPQKMASVAALNGLDDIERIWAGALLDLGKASSSDVAVSDDSSSPDILEAGTLTEVFTFEVYDPSDKVKEPVVKSDLGVDSQIADGDPGAKNSAVLSMGR